MRRALLLCAAVLLLFAASSTLASGKPDGDGIDREGLRREREVVDLLNEAMADVLRADCGCRRERPPEATVTHDAPSAELLATLGVLRRPVGPHDAYPADELRHLPADGVYVDYIRVARSAAGREFHVIAARNTAIYRPPPRRCAVAWERRVRRLAARRSRDVRRSALREVRRLIRSEMTASERAPREGVFLFDRSGGAGGGGVGIDRLRKEGMFGSGDGSGVAPRGHSLLSGLLPDGVASLTATFARRVSRGPHRPPAVYPSTVTRTAPVRDNVVSFTVPRPAPDAFPTRMVWRAEDGSVVRVVRGRR